MRIMMSPYAGAASNFASFDASHVPIDAQTIASCESYPYFVVFGSWSNLVSGVFGA